MAIYTVHVPRGLGDPILRAERTAFVRDGFSVAAFLYGPLYLLRHRAFLGAAAWIVGVLAIAGVSHVLRLPLATEVAVALLIMLFTGLEASSIRRFALYRRGLDAAGVVSASSVEDGEVVFFRAETARPPSSASAVSGGARTGRASPTGIIGLFPETEA